MCENCEHNLTDGEVDSVNMALDYLDFAKKVAMLNLAVKSGKFLILPPKAYNNFIKCWEFYQYDPVGLKNVYCCEHLPPSHKEGTYVDLKQKELLTLKQLTKTI